MRLLHNIALFDNVVAEIKNEAKKLGYLIINDNLLNEGVVNTLSKLNNSSFKTSHLSDFIKFPIDEKIHDSITGTEIRNTLLEANIRYSIVNESEKYLSEKGFEIKSISQKIEEYNGSEKKLKLKQR